MNQEEFKMLYIGEWEPDTQLEDCINFLRSASEKEKLQARREKWFERETWRDAKRIIDREAI